jgi:pimeloyl-ACP methyl ester carboxylesterase
VAPPVDAFTIHRTEVDDGLRLAYVREGVGGAPLLLIHGYPETKRIWWRNVAPLAAAGFEVIAPDLRGYGDSDLSATDSYDIVRYSLDLHALMGALGHERCAVVASDVGGVVATDLSHRFPGFIERMCLFNTVPPMGADYASSGLDPSTFSATDGGPASDYQELQGNRPDELIAMLPTDAARRQWVANMYRGRLWGSPGAFSDEDVAFMTEPFASEDRLRASWAPYQLAYGRPMVDIPRMEAVEVPTLVLYGPDDHVVRSDFIAFCEVAYTNRIGPLAVPGAGHFLQWERADIFNPLVSAVLR